MQNANYDQINQSILLQAKGVGERFKGHLTARTETIKGLALYYQQHNNLG